ncbi:MAG: RidA family protein [Dehalococcoidia bacterium]|nr:RidA family protein [Dehalococcoidia bacterium]
MAKEIIVPKNVRKARGFADAIKVGKTIYVAGQVARDESGTVVGKGDIVAQTEQAYENLKRVLAAAGASVTDIVKMNIFCLDLDRFKKTGEVRRRYFGDHFPATTAVQVARLMDPDYLIEVEVIAVLD